MLSTLLIILNYPVIHLMVAFSLLNMWRGLLLILFLSIELPVVYHKLKYWILHAENFISIMPHILYWNLHNLMFTVLCLLCLFAYITYSFVQHPYTYCVVRNLAIKNLKFSW